MLNGAQTWVDYTYSLKEEHGCLCCHPFGCRILSVSNGSSWVQPYGRVMVDVLPFLGVGFRPCQMTGHGWTLCGARFRSMSASILLGCMIPPLSNGWAWLDLMWGMKEESSWAEGDALSRSSWSSASKTATTRYKICWFMIFFCRSY